MPHPRVKELIAALRLQPHPEGGLFAELYRDPDWVKHPKNGQMRPMFTLIHFLLPAKTFSALHRVAQAEAWHHLEGDPVEIHTLTPEGTHALTVIGKNVAAGEKPQFVVRAGLWQAAVPRGDTYALVGCTVAPGFEFADFEMPSRDALLAAFPQHADLVKRLTHDAEPPST
jgi:predicted cupin superfamily sugar epimerase